MSRIIVTVLLGFLQFGTLTSVLVFIYVFGANAFFLVSLSSLAIHPSYLSFFPSGLYALLPLWALSVLSAPYRSLLAITPSRCSLSLFFVARYRSLARCCC
jgi:hypothetical protein